MPWREPEYEGEFPSLGWLVLDWAQAEFKVPDGPYAGEQLTLTDEQATILVRYYQLDNRGRFVFRRGAVRRSQGWGKSPLLAICALAELCGPSRFGGWDADGEPVGVEPTTPWVQVAAVSEDQTENTYAALYTMASESDLSGSVLDVGLTRIFVPGSNGRLEPVTAAAGTRLGQRVSFAVLDETHLWTSRNGGKKLAATIRRNAGKMNGRTFESTNAHEPGEESVAEMTYEAAQHGAAGLMYDAVEAPHVEDLSNRKEVVAALKIAYGDAKWVDLNRIAAEIADPSTDPNDARRFYFNQLVSDSGRPVDIPKWETLERPDIEVPLGSYIGLGFDGSISDDSTVLYGCTTDGHVFEIEAWERTPDLPRDWVVPRGAVAERVARAFSDYRVGRMFCDPPKWWTEIEGWASQFGEETVLAFPTNSARRFAPACGRFSVAVREGSITHDGKPGLTTNLAACAKKRVRLADDDEDGRTPFVIVKADTRKIDRAVGAILALEAAKTMPVEQGPIGVWDLNEVVARLRSEQAGSPVEEFDGGPAEQPGSSTGQRFIPLGDMPRR